MNLTKFCTDQPSVKLTCCYLILSYEEKLQAGAVAPSPCVFRPPESSSADLKDHGILHRFVFIPLLFRCPGVGLDPTAQGLPWPRAGFGGRLWARAVGSDWAAPPVGKMWAMLWGVTGSFWASEVSSVFFWRCGCPLDTISWAEIGSCAPSVSVQTRPSADRCAGSLRSQSQAEETGISQRNLRNLWEEWWATGNKEGVL